MSDSKQDINKYFCIMTTLSLDYFLNQSEKEGKTIFFLTGKSPWSIIKGNTLLCYAQFKVEKTEFNYGFKFSIPLKSKKTKQTSNFYTLS